MLRAFQNGRLKVEEENGEVRVIGPSGNPLKFSLNDGYPKVSVTKTNPSRRMRNIYVHVLRVLWDNWEKLNDKNLLDQALYPEDYQIDHIDRNPHNNSLRNLRVVPVGQNQSNKRTRKPEINPTLEGLILEIFATVPDIKKEVFCNSIRITRHQLEEILRKREK